MDKVRVAIVGAAGYAGEELLRLLSRHPYADIRVITSRQNAGKDIAEIISEAAGTPDVGVKILGSHSCMTARGIRNASARTETRTYTGDFKSRRDLQELLD